MLIRSEKDTHAMDLMESSLFEENSISSIDHKSKESYKNRILEIQEELNEAEEFQDESRLEALRLEYDQILSFLSKNMGLAGKSRKTGSSVEKARTAVTWRIRNAIKKIHDVEPVLGKHLKHSIQTGTFCSYRPELEIEWEFIE